MTSCYWKGEADLSADMIRALRTYRRTTDQSARIAQAAAIEEMARNLSQWAAKESAKPPPMPKWWGQR